MVVGACQVCHRCERVLAADVIEKLELRMTIKLYAAVGIWVGLI